MSMFCDKYAVTEKKTLAKEIYSVTVKAPEVVKAAGHKLKAMESKIYFGSSRTEMIKFLIDCRKNPA